MRLAPSISALTCDPGRFDDLPASRATGGAGLLGAVLADAVRASNEAGDLHRVDD
jgi:hypothetical protein